MHLLSSTCSPKTQNDLFPSICVCFCSSSSFALAGRHLGRVRFQICTSHSHASPTQRVCVCVCHSCLSFKISRHLKAGACAIETRISNLVRPRSDAGIGLPNTYFLCFSSSFFLTRSLLLGNAITRRLVVVVCCSFALIR